MEMRLSIRSVTTWGMPFACALRYSSRFASRFVASSAIFSVVASRTRFSAALLICPPVCEDGTPRLLYLTFATRGGDDAFDAFSPLPFLAAAAASCPSICFASSRCCDFLSLPASRAFLPFAARTTSDPRDDDADGEEEEEEGEIVREIFLGVVVVVVVVAAARRDSRATDAAGARADIEIAATRDAIVSVATARARRGVRGVAERPTGVISRGDKWRPRPRSAPPDGDGR